MKAVVLAAGEGRRLEPLTHVRPKPMVPIANRPLLEYVVEAVAAAGIEEVVLVVGYKRERIQSHFEDGDAWGVEIEYAVQEKQLGTGHAILRAESLVDGDFLVLNGDRIIDASIVERLVEADRDGDVLMAVTRAEEPERYGVVELDGDRVAAIAEKPPSHAVSSDVINAGIYRFGPGIFDEIGETAPTERGEMEITATLERCIGDEAVRAIRYRGLWLDVSQLWDVVGVNASVLDRRGSTVADTARVHDGATVAGAVAIGADTVVGPNATVLRGTALGDNVSVGPNAVLSNAVVLADATIEAGAVVCDAVVGENARVGANTTIEGGPADVVVDGDLYPAVTLGGVVGDNATLGGSATVVPGTVIGGGAVAESGTRLSGRIPTDAEVRRG